MKLCEVFLFLSDGQGKDRMQINIVRRDWPPGQSEGNLPLDGTIHDAF